MYRDETECSDRWRAFDAVCYGQDIPECEAVYDAYNAKTLLALSSRSETATDEESSGYSEFAKGTAVGALSASVALYLVKKSFCGKKQGFDEFHRI